MKTWRVQLVGGRKKTDYQVKMHDLLTVAVLRSTDDEDLDRLQALIDEARSGKKDDKEAT